MESWTPYPGGAPANVATATSKLGLHSVLLSAIGNDELGDRFMELLQGMIYPVYDVFLLAEALVLLVFPVRMHARH